MVNFPHAKLSRATVARCFCVCNSRKEEVSECACPPCTDMECELRALRDIGRYSKKCEDSECIKFKKTLISPQTWTEYNSCDKVVLDGFARKNMTFEMRHYRCCLAANDGSITPCDKCSNRMVLPSCNCFTAGKHVTWLKRQATIEGTTHNKLAVRLREYNGKLSELWESIKAKTKPYMAHMWRCKFLRQNFHIDCDEFDADTEALILADFASQMVLHTY